MTSALQQRLSGLADERLRGVRRGIEKESLRVLAAGGLALTPHPRALGSALTHPHITTDYSESQLELITGVHATPASCLQELMDIHQFTSRVLREQGDEMMWVCSMPCGLPTDETIPLARYGASNVGRAKSVYRMGLGHRYGRRMQTISGIHYNWSLPGLSDDDYFALIRNFRRHAFLLLVLLGASPAVCGSFVAGRDHELQPLGQGSMHMPYGTSLRMGRLGYQSDAQATLAVSYNGLEGYAASLHDALMRPYPAYEAVGIRNPGGDYNQLATTLLQIENEFYGTIRPKRTIFQGERPLHALRERGVEYVEVRLLDLDPFEPIGIREESLRLLDVFLLHCLLADSPPDTPQEIAELKRNQHLIAARGREPGLTLERNGQPVELMAWADELLAACDPIAARLDQGLDQGVDQGLGKDAADTPNAAPHATALRNARARLRQPDQLPSARVLQAVQGEHGGSFVAFARKQSVAARDHILSLPFSDAQRARYVAMGEQSWADQRAIEAADTLPFEQYRQQYVSEDRLGRPGMRRA